MSEALKNVLISRLSDQNRRDWGDLCADHTPLESVLWRDVCAPVDLSSAERFFVLRPESKVNSIADCT